MGFWGDTLLPKLRHHLFRKVLIRFIVDRLLKTLRQFVEGLLKLFRKIYLIIFIVELTYKYSNPARDTI